MLLYFRSPPSGTPGLAEFAREVNDSSKPRFNIKEAYQNVKDIMAGLPIFYPEARQKEWAKFFEDFPKSVADVKVSEAYKVKVDAIPPCSMRLPANMGLRQHQVCEQFTRLWQVVTSQFCSRHC